MPAFKRSVDAHARNYIRTPFGSLISSRSRRYGHNAKVVHFLGKAKPWHHSYDAQRGEVIGHGPSADPHQLQPDYLLSWWQLYSKSVVPLLQRAYGDAPFCSGLAVPSQEVN